MASTGVMAQMLGDWLLVGHVGDSRAYLIRDDALHQITEDHSLARTLLARGAITPAEAANYPQNVIVRAIGPQPTVEPDVVCFDLLPRDVILLCSDGLSGPVSEPEIARLVAAGPPSAAVMALIERANQCGGPDNISAIVGRATGAMPASPVVRMENAVEMLRDIFLFQSLTFQEPARVLALVQELRFAAGQVLFREGDPGDALLIVAEGEVEISHRGMAVTTIPRGGHFGELGLVAEGVRSASARALKPTIVLSLGRDALFHIVRHDGDLAAKLLWGLVRNLGDRVKTLSSELGDARKR
jgi:hypothetical protein